MQALLRTAAGILVLSVSAQCHALSLIEWSYAYLLVTKTHVLPVKAVTEAATADRKLISEEFLDVAAEVLWERAEDKSVSNEVVQLLWSLLHEVNVPRYRKVLVETGAATAKSEMQAFAKALAKKGKPDLNTPETYQRGTISLSALKRQYIEDSLQVPVPAANARAIARLALQQPAEEAFEIMGYPQAVDASFIDSPFFPSTFRLSLFYRGQGAVVLQKRRGASKGRAESEQLWTVAQIVENPLAYELDMPYVALTDDGYKAAKRKVHFNILLYGDSLGIRRLMEGIYRGTAAVDPAILDLAAEHLANEHGVANDGAQVDALAWISKTLALKGAGRYDTLLKMVSHRAPSVKLRKYSTQKGSASGASIEQFEAATLDLAGLRQAYPPLYASVAREREERLEASEAQTGDRAP